MTSSAPVRSSYQILCSHFVVVGELLTELFVTAASALLKFNGNINTYCFCCVLFFNALFTRHHSVGGAGIYYLQLNNLGVRSHFIFCPSLQLCAHFVLFSVQKRENSCHFTGKNYPRIDGAGGIKPKPIAAQHVLAVVVVNKYYSVTHTHTQACSEQ